jgi:predicted Ser/Thr protein kinase
MKQAMNSEQPAAVGPLPTTSWKTTFTPPDPSELAEFFPQLEILELVGQGGMGAVYKARQVSLDRLVALKILPPEAAADPAFAERFTREARALAKLSHPNIVAVYDSGQTTGRTANPSSDDADELANHPTAPIYYFLMEYIDGVNLREAQQAATLSPEQALEIVPQVCEALQYAHDQGIVHRDIKPENVLLDKSGSVKVADFGLSKLLAHTPVNVTLTASHQVMGTLHYMAPEQMQRPLEVDHRADIYSLGVVFYELLTGEVPIGRFPLPSEKLKADTRLDDVVLKAMEREPDRRYQQASHVKTDIESLPAVGQVSNLASQREDETRDARSWRTAQPFSEIDFEDARRQVQAPAIGLIVAGALSLAPAILIFVGFVLAVPVMAQEVPAEPLVLAQSSGGIGAPGWVELLIIAAVMGLNLPLGIVVLIGGLKMRKLESYGLAMTASILAVVPSGVGCIIGLPFGIWSLIVLLRPEIRAAFDRRRNDPNDPSPSRERQSVDDKPLSENDRSHVHRMINGPAIGLFCVAFVALLPLILAIVAFAVRFLFGPS